MRSSTPFTFVDLFAGIGGFHAALESLGGRCVYASEIDESAAKIYQHNWDMSVAGDIVRETEPEMLVPPHDVLAAGFPCQPFSKSGYQFGMEESRGTLFWSICRIIEARRPSLVILENVRNIAGPRHIHEWEVIVRSLRQLGYRVSSAPAVFSPHLLPPWMGGAPQVRERVFILAHYVGAEAARIDTPPLLKNRPLGAWDPQGWNLADYLESDDEIADRGNYLLSKQERKWVHAWGDFVDSLRADGAQRLPGFPIWADAFVSPRNLVIPRDTPEWKRTFLRKNAELYGAHRGAIDGWFRRWGRLRDFPSSRRKFEWQAQDAGSLDQCILHFRPSGIRVKKATYVPALVAINQTTILGSQLRRLTPRECARMQGLPDSFEFPGQADALSYKQLGNGVNVGVVRYAARALMDFAGDPWSSPGALTRDLSA